MTESKLDLGPVRARGVGNAVFIEHIGGCGDIAAIGVGTREFAQDLAGELNRIFNGFRAALADSARVAGEYAHHVSLERKQLTDRAELAEWKLKKLHQHLAWDGGATCDIGTMLGIIGGTVTEPGGECGICKTACHPENDVCKACLVRDEVASALESMDELAELWGDEGKFRRCRDRLRVLVEAK